MLDVVIRSSAIAERGGRPVPHGMQAIDALPMIANKSGNNHLFAMVDPALPSHAVPIRHTRTSECGNMLIENAAAMSMAHRRALGQAVDHLPRQFWALLDYCGMEGRICPGPEAWHRMWKLLHARATDRKPPRPPAPDEPRNSLKWALVDHLLWADQLGMFGEVDQYLRGLVPDQWAMTD